MPPTASTILPPSGPCIVSCRRLARQRCFHGKRARPADPRVQLQAALRERGSRSLKNAFEAAKIANIPRDRIVIIQEPYTVLKYSESNYGRIQRKSQGAWTLAGLIEEGRDIVKAKGDAILASTRYKLKPGEAKTKIAFLLFSSGTGLPKGVAIQHFAVTSNALQTMAFNKVGSSLGAKGRFCPGKDVSLGVLPQVHIFGLSTCTHFPFYAGIANVVISKFRGIEAMIKTIIKYKISVWWLVPPMVVLFCKDPSVAPYWTSCARWRALPWSALHHCPKT